MPKSVRLSLLETLYDQLSKGNPELVELDIDVSHSESAMRAANVAVPKFFKEGGMLGKLLERYPAFAGDEATAMAAEEEAILSLVETIRTFLAESRDRLTDANVGEEAARNAVNDLASRRRHEYMHLNQHTGTEAHTFDDVGRYHTALRAILADATLGGFYTKQYFSRQAKHGYRYPGKDFITFRRILALSWLGAKEADIEPPLYDAGMPQADLSRFSMEEFISVVAQIRREHNFDMPTNGCAGEIDRQTCPSGLLGRICSGLLRHNERYVDSYRDLNVSIFQSRIRDFMVEAFEHLDDRAKSLIVSYIDDKSVMMLEASDEAKAAMQTFINGLKADLLEALMKELNQAADNTPLGRIKVFYHHLKSEARVNEEAQLAVDLIDVSLQQLIEVEADSLTLDIDNNLASMDFLRRFVQSGVSCQHQFDILSALKSVDVEALARFQIIYTKAQSLQYLVDSHFMRQYLFDGQEWPAHVKANYLERIRRYMALCDEAMTALGSMDIDGRESHGRLVAQIGMMGDKEINTSVKVAGASFADNKKRQAYQLISDLKVQLLKLECHCERETLDRDCLRTSIQSVLSADGDYRSAREYANYIVTLLLEKTDVGEYINDSEHARELTKVLDLIFARESSLTQEKKEQICDALNQALADKVSFERQDESVYEQIEMLEKYMADYDYSLATFDYKNLNMTDITYSLAHISSEQSGPSMVDPGFLIDFEADLNSSIALMCEQTQAPEDARRLELLMTVKESLVRGDSSAQKLTHFINAIAILPIGAAHGHIGGHCRQVWQRSIQHIFSQASLPVEKRLDVIAKTVALTLMYNLGIEKFRFEDYQTLKDICSVYLTGKPDSIKPVMYPIGSEQSAKVMSLVSHLSLMITTLSPPAIKASFSEGIVRLMQRGKAYNRLSPNTYIIRLSNTEANRLVITSKGNQARANNLAHRDNIFLRSGTKNRYNVDGTRFTFIDYAVGELSAVVSSKMSGKVAYDADVTVRALDTTAHFDAQRAAHESQMPSNYRPRSRDGGLPSSLMHTDEVSAFTDAEVVTRGQRQQTEEQHGAVYMCFDFG